MTSFESAIYQVCNEACPGFKSHLTGWGAKYDHLKHGIIVWFATEEKENTGLKSGDICAWFKGKETLRVNVSDPDSISLLKQKLEEWTS